MAQANRWRSHRVLGAVVSGAAVAVPFAVSLAAAVAVGHLVPRGHDLAGHALWWVMVLGSSSITFVGSERLCRRALPLAALLRMTMLFPDQAPKRLKVAWRAGLTRQLERSSNGTATANPQVPAEVAAEILALATTLSRHDRRTRGHSERVRAFTDMIADELRLPLADRDRLRWSALLHDVGKLTVHPDILNKEGKLTNGEWEEIRNHPLEGRALIAPLAPWLGPWSLAIEQHHEHYDGSGYPFGLSGEELSLGARIVSVADAFEVMTAARSYKKAMSPVAARTELTRCAGTQFDPAIVRAFLNVSIGRLRWTIGPLSWVADVPFAARLGAVGHSVLTGAQVAVGAIAVTAGGVLATHATAQTPPPARLPHALSEARSPAPPARATTTTSLSNLTSLPVTVPKVVTTLPRRQKTTTSKPAITTTTRPTATTATTARPAPAQGSAALATTTGTISVAVPSTSVSTTERAATRAPTGTTKPSTGTTVERVTRTTAAPPTGTTADPPTTARPHPSTVTTVLVPAGIAGPAATSAPAPGGPPTTTPLTTATTLRVTTSSSPALTVTTVTLLSTTTTRPPTTTTTQLVTTTSQLVTTTTRPTTTTQLVTTTIRSTTTTQLVTTTTHPTTTTAAPTTITTAPTTTTATPTTTVVPTTTAAPRTTTPPPTTIRTVCILGILCL